MCRCSGHNRADNSHQYRRQNHNIGRAVARGLGSVALGVGTTIALGFIGKLLNGSAAEEQLYEAPLKETPAKDVVTPPKEEVVEEALTPEEAVKKLVNVDKTSDPELFEDLVKKYNSIKKANNDISDEILALRLRNYVTGYNNQQIALRQKAEQESVYSYVDNKLDQNAANRDATINGNVRNILKSEYNDNKISYDREKVKTNQDLQNHFKKLSLQYLELRDSDSSCDLDFLEIFTSNLANEYLKEEGCKNYREAIQKAEKYVQENKTNLLNQYTQWINNNTANISEDMNMEDILALNSYMELAKLDRSGDKKLDDSEIAEFLLAKSTYTDGENPDYDISTADDFAFELDLVNNPDKLDSYLQNAHNFMKNTY